MRRLERLSWVAMALVAAQIVVGLGMSIVGNPDGWLGGVLFALAYGLPLMLIALALGSSASVLHKVAGWAALFFAAYYSLIILVNWSGYSSVTAILAASVTAPTVLLDLVIFWATVLHQRRRTSTSGA